MPSMSYINTTHPGRGEGGLREPHQLLALWSKIGEAFICILHLLQYWIFSSSPYLMGKKPNLTHPKLPNPQLKACLGFSEGGQKGRGEPWQSQHHTGALASSSGSAAVTLCNFMADNFRISFSTMTSWQVEHELDHKNGPSPFLPPFPWCADVLHIILPKTCLIQVAVSWDEQLAIRTPGRFHLSMTTFPSFMMQGL